MTRSRNQGLFVAQSKLRSGSNGRQDYFSSCLLMPRQYVLGAWSAYFGSLKPSVFADVADRDWTHRNKYRSPRAVELHAYAFETIFKEFKLMFRVSTQAVQIRLEDLGLLRIDHLVERDFVRRGLTDRFFLRDMSSVSSATDSTSPAICAATASESIDPQPVARGSKQHDTDEQQQTGSGAEPWNSYPEKYATAYGTASLN